MYNPNNVIKPVGHVVGKIVEPVADVASVVMPEFAPEIQLAKKGVKAITKGKGAMNDKHIGSLYGEAIMREHPDINKHQFIQGFHQTWNIPEKEKRTHIFPVQRKKMKKARKRRKRTK